MLAVGSLDDLRPKGHRVGLRHRTGGVQGRRAAAGERELGEDVHSATVCRAVCGPPQMLSMTRSTAMVMVMTTRSGFARGGR